MSERKDIKECFKPFNPEDWGVSEIGETLIRVAVQLENERKELGMTQEELSEKSGIDQGHISRIERLECVPSFGTLYKLAKGLGKELVVEIK